MNPCHFHPSTPSGDLLFFGGVLDQERGRYHLARCQTQDQWAQSARPMAYGANVFLPKVPRPALEFAWVGKSQSRISKRKLQWEERL